MAKTINLGASSRDESKNKRYRVSYTLNGKKVTTAGMLFGGKDAEQAAASYVRRTLVNLGIVAPATFEVEAADKR